MPRAEVYRFGLNFNISKLVYCITLQFKCDKYDSSQFVLIVSLEKHQVPFMLVKDQIKVDYSVFNYLIISLNKNTYKNNVNKKRLLL